MKLSKVLLALLFISACASSSAKFDLAKLSELQKGKTTYSEVLNKFGTPDATYIKNNGDTIIAYTYGNAQSRPETTMPVIGGYVDPGVNSGRAVVKLRFSRDNVLSKIDSSQASTGNGLQNQ